MSPVPAWWYQDAVWTEPVNDNAELARTAANEAYLRWTNPVRQLKRYEGTRWDHAWEETI